LPVCRSLSGLGAAFESEDQRQGRFDLLHIRRGNTSDPAYEPRADNGSDCSADGAAGTLDAGGGLDLDTERRRSQRTRQGYDDDQFSRCAGAQFIDGDNNRGGESSPGSPTRPAPSATSQTSPRRGTSVETILEGAFPLAEFGPRVRILLIDAVGLMLRAPNGLASTLFANLAEQCRHRHSTLARLLSEEIARRAGHRAQSVSSARGVGVQDIVASGTK